MEKTSRLAAAYDHIAATYDTAFTSSLNRAEDAVVFAWLRRWGLHRRKILDLGCGTGLYLDHVRKDYPFYVGIDISPAMVAHARAKHPNRLILEGDIRDLAIQGGDLYSAAFDCGGAVSLYGSFNYLTDGDEIQALRGLYHVLKPGSRFGLMVYSQRYQRRPSYVLHDVDLPRIYYDSALLRGNLQIAGFTVERIEGFNWWADYLPRGLPQSWYETWLNAERRRLAASNYTPNYYTAIARKPMTAA